MERQAISFVFLSQRARAHTHGHTKTRLLTDCSVALSLSSLPLNPTSLHHQIPRWLTARAQRQVEWPLYSLSFSPRHLSNSPHCSVLLGERERGKEAPKPPSFRGSDRPPPPGGAVAADFLRWTVQSKDLSWQSVPRPCFSFSLFSSKMTNHRPSMFCVTNGAESGDP